MFPSLRGHSSGAVLNNIKNYSQKSWQQSLNLFKPDQKSTLDISNEEDQDKDWTWYSFQALKLQHFCARVSTTTKSCCSVRQVHKYQKVLEDAGDLVLRQEAPKKAGIFFR